MKNEESDRICRKGVKGDAICFIWDKVNHTCVWPTKAVNTSSHPSHHMLDLLKDNKMTWLGLDRHTGLS